MSSCLVSANSQTHTDIIFKALDTSEEQDVSTVAKSDISTIPEKSPDTTFVVPVECTTKSQPKRFVELIVHNIDFTFLISISIL